MCNRIFLSVIFEQENTAKLPILLGETLQKYIVIIFCVTNFANYLLFHRHLVLLKQVSFQFLAPDYLNCGPLSLLPSGRGK